MNIYKPGDIALIKDNMKEIADAINRRKLQLLEPREDEVRAVTEVILKFIKEKKRKIYGGFAMNMFLKAKNPADAIYSEFDLPDIDFYSPEPLKDLNELCNLLHDAGFEKVQGAEGQHEETYKIFVNLNDYVDISYVPRLVYNRMPFIDIDGVYVIHPFFVMIDHYRMLTDPLFSQWRWEKSISRFPLIEKHYPIQRIERPIKLPKVKENLDGVLGNVFEFLTNRDSTITISWYPYNVLLKESGIKKEWLKPINITCFDIVSTNYVEDANNLITLLKDKYGSDISVVEHHPFFQLLHYSVIINYKGVPIAKVYSHGGRCLPYQDVAQKEGGFVRIGSFNTTVLYFMMMVIRERVSRNNDIMSQYNKAISHLHQMREHYFKKNSKNMLDETMFKEFSVECLGTATDPKRESFVRMDKRAKKKKPRVYRYNPEDGKRPAPEFSFANSSGNPITNVKKLQLNRRKNEKAEEDSSEPVSTEEEIESQTQLSEDNKSQDSRTSN